MTDSQAVLSVLEDYGPLSDYGILHAAKAKGYKMTPSSARTRRSELVTAKKVRAARSYELSSTGRRAQQWEVAR
ncbi:MAG: hypothetical protein OJJ55_06585 [Rhodococcus sp.]|nr:hypothetical protein [Rhodococcus sp. (in: high G+C Gram-positive bacteria)]